MAKPVAGEVVVLPAISAYQLATGQASPSTGCRRMGGSDLILCQITSQAHRDSSSISLDVDDFQSGQLSVRRYVRPNRLFTVEQSVILYSAGRLTRAKLDETLANLRQLFS